MSKSIKPARKKRLLFKNLSVTSNRMRRSLSLWLNKTSKSRMRNNLEKYLVKHRQKKVSNQNRLPRKNAKPLNPVPKLVKQKQARKTLIRNGDCPLLKRKSPKSIPASNTAINPCLVVDRGHLIEAGSAIWRGFKLCGAWRCSGFWCSSLGQAMYNSSIRLFLVKKARALSPQPRPKPPTEV